MVGLDYDQALMQGLERALAQLSLFEHLRPDEVGRIAARFHVETVTAGTAGAARTFEASGDDARMIVAVSGRVRVEVDSPAGTLRSVLEPGDRHGDVTLLTRAWHVVACRRRRRRRGHRHDRPRGARRGARRVPRRGAAARDGARQRAAVAAATSPASSSSSTPRACPTRSSARRSTSGGASAHAARRARRPRGSARALPPSRRAQQGAEPPFWMLVGFIVVARRRAPRRVAHPEVRPREAALRARAAANDPNPMHVHHFNYGLVLIGASRARGALPVRAPGAARSRGRRSAAGAASSSTSSRSSGT